MRLFILFIKYNFTSCENYNIKLTLEDKIYQEIEKILYK